MPSAILARRSANVAELKFITAAPVGKGAAERLGTALGLAASGEVSSVAIAIVRRDGSPEWMWSDAPNTSTLLGSIERMKYAMMQSKDG